MRELYFHACCEWCLPLNEGRICPIVQANHQSEFSKAPPEDQLHWPSTSQQQQQLSGHQCFPLAIDAADGAMTNWCWTRQNPSDCLACPKSEVDQWQQVQQAVTRRIEADVRSFGVLEQQTRCLERKQTHLWSPVYGGDPRSHLLHDRC